jgi:3-oxoadipate enol-lactonase
MRTFVWGHGLTSSMAKEDRTGLMAWTMPDGWELVRYDAAGHGTSDVADPDTARYGWERLAGDMLDRGPDRFVAGGASMGCATTLHAAVQAPERVDAMVLVIPPTAWATRATQRDLYEGAAHVVEKYGVARLREVIAERPTPAIFDDHPELTEYAPDIAEPLLPTVLRGAAASDLPATDALAQLPQPALVLAWDTDPGHPVSTAEALHDVLPTSMLHLARTLDDVRGWPSLVAGFLTSL